MSDVPILTRIASDAPRDEIAFTLDGRECTGFEGDTVLTALLTHGDRVRETLVAFGIGAVDVPPRGKYKDKLVVAKLGKVHFCLCCREGPLETKKCDRVADSPIKEYRSIDDGGVAILRDVHA